jgi:hypothetical protein
MKGFTYILMTVVLLFCSQALAKGMQFGEQDSFRKIQDVEFQDPKGRDLYLGYRITTKFFIAGVNLTDQGYVLAVKGSEEQEYYALSAEQIKALQAEGGLPKPLPKYVISTLDYAIGYSLWIIVAFMAVFFGIKRFFKKNTVSIEQAA